MLSPEKKYKQLFLSTIIGIVVCLAGIVTFVVVVDPYQQYRASDRFVGNQRLEIPGVARTHDYNAFVTGSSMAMNHYPRQIDSVFSDAPIPWKTMNFSIMGARWDDYERIIRYAANLGKAKNIIFDLDYFSFAAQRNAAPDYLCNATWSDDYKYWLNFTAVKDAIIMMGSKPSNEDYLYHFNSLGGRDNLLEDFDSHKNTGYTDEDFTLQPMIEKFDRYFADMIRTAPQDITWHIYFPPYSEKEFEIYRIHGDYDNIMVFKRHITETLLAMPNVRLHDFQCSPWIDNENEYMDLRHHSHAYNRQIIQEIHDSTYFIRH